jgi:Fcf2 pre-rRNA processing
MDTMWRSFAIAARSIPSAFTRAWIGRKGSGAWDMIQVGTVVEDSVDFYSNRLTQAQRRGNETDELLANGDATYAKAKFKRMQQEKTVVAQKRRRTPCKAPLSLRKGKR